MKNRFHLCENTEKLRNFCLMFCAIPFHCMISKWCLNSKNKNSSYEADPFQKDREQLFDFAAKYMNLKNPDILRACKTVPRHKFVPSREADQAYDDCALPIGCGQTISQPSLVAQMIELLELQPGDKVLEVGTGSGYQTALLAELGYGDVFSVEIIPELYERAKRILDELGYTNVKIKLGDGYYGWPEYAPYNAIVVTAAAEKVPPPLLEQLDEGGVLLIPIGPRNQSQTLWKFVKKNGKKTQKDVGNVIFVPFVGKGIRND